MLDICTILAQVPRAKDWESWLPGMPTPETQFSHFLFTYVVPASIYILVTVLTVFYLFCLSKEGVKLVPIRDGNKINWTGLKEYFKYTERAGSYVVEIVCFASYWHWLSDFKRLEAADPLCQAGPEVAPTMALLIVIAELYICVLMRKFFIPWIIIALLVIGVVICPSFFFSSR